jgi:hypothetical protein
VPDEEKNFGPSGWRLCGEADNIPIPKPIQYSYSVQNTVSTASQMNTEQAALERTNRLLPSDAARTIEKTTRPTILL